MAQARQRPGPYATHKTPEVKAWLAKHPRFKLHFTPTCASWLNLVERFFAEITLRRIRRGIPITLDDQSSRKVYDPIALRHCKKYAAENLPRLNLLRTLGSLSPINSASWA